MIASKVEHKACYKALHRLDEIERQLREVTGILKTLGTMDADQALIKLKNRRNEILVALEEYTRFGIADVSVPNLDSALAGVRPKLSEDLAILEEEARRREADAMWREGERQREIRCKQRRKYNYEGGIFSVSFTKYDRKRKISIIKEIRQVARGLGLKEAKELVEAVDNLGMASVRELSGNDATVLCSILADLDCNPSTHEYAA